MTKKFDLLVVGEINPDLILRGQDVRPLFGQAEKLVEQATLTIGSSSVIMACGAARLGLRVAFVGVVGDDEFGRFMLSSMSRQGINTDGCVIDDRLTTGLSVVLSQPHDRAILTYPGSIPTLRREHINTDLLYQARHLHVGSYFLLDGLRPDMPDLYAEARRHGLTTSLDTNWDPRETWDGGVEQLWPYCDLLLPNEAEVRLLSGKDDLDEALADMAGRLSLLAVKMGAAGGLVRRRGEQVRRPSLAVEVVDTTGAGDSFDAGFLYGFLNGWSLADACGLACACGSLSTRAAGGTAAQPTLAEALTAMREAGWRVAGTAHE